QQHQIHPELAALPHDFHADSLERRLETETSVNANHHQVEKIGKQTAIPYHQQALAPRYKRGWRQISDNKGTDHQCQLYGPAIVLHPNEREHAGKARKHGRPCNSDEDVVADVLHIKKACAQQIAPQFSFERILQTETFFIEIARYERVH